MKSKLVFIVLFTVLGFGALQVPVNEIVGSDARFTLFDLLAPVSGAFLGTPLGIISVFLMQILNLAVHGFSSIDRASIIRLFPIMFGIWFFARKDRQVLIVPALAILAFNLHPEGRAAWFYSSFWLIPCLAWRFRDRFLIAKSLGTTFTMHSVGSIAFLYAFNLPSSVWISLIPVVIFERSIFTLGISASYLLMNNVLGFLSVKKLLPTGIKIAKNYLLGS